MPLTAAKRYLQRIAAWQASTGLSGAPPVAFDKQLSNWVQYCRTIGRRGHLNAEVSEAFTKLGIALDRGPTDANANNTSSFTGPRGFVPVLHAAIAYMEEHGAAPSLRAPNENVRHQAAWLIRLQAGILPANSFGWTAPSEAQVLPQQVLDMAHEVQSPREMVAEWLLWCARAQLALDRPAPGNNWQETTYACSHNLLVRRYPDPGGTFRTRAQRRLGASQ